MKISLFKLKKNRRYNYTPRYYSGKEGGNLYDFTLVIVPTMGELTTITTALLGLGKSTR